MNVSTLIAVGIASVLAAAPQDKTPVDRSRKCGLGAAFHAGRRAALRAQLGEGLVLVRGLPPTRDYAPFRQDKTFWYLTGVESQDAALLLDAKSGEETLFLPRPDPKGEVWEGELWDTGDAWVNKEAVWHMIKRLDPTFDPKDHGYANFPAMVKALEDVVEVKKGDSDQVVRIRT